MRIGLVGFAGSGKTTVFNTLTGLHAARLVSITSKGISTA